jgi:hypothetical protein
MDPGRDEDTRTVTHVMCCCYLLLLKMPIDPSML